MKIISIVLLLLISTQVFAYKKMSQDRVLHDSQVAGGENLRSVDRWASEKFGGYRTGGTGVYANYIEPSLHAMEHTRRAVFNNNGEEWKRAKDEMRSVGNGGLNAMAQNQFSGGPNYQAGTYKRP
ncbi:hypothetical protein CYY_002254 [Polysphondylium violaceum]|uniref:Serum amyloid A protein n=1 Tax=Polysphondylium violaceum TaxID=133409 RepID=A0A8J4Q848_9MYCE|nr:hypothetical protein CYY_002254 [Polysphondylium violaceum]